MAVWRSILTVTLGLAAYFKEYAPMSPQSLPTSSQWLVDYYHSNFDSFFMNIPIKPKVSFIGWPTRILFTEQRHA